MKKRVLIVDQNNAFLRAYIVDPSISQNGNPIGGLQGSLKILQKLVKEIKPDKIVICWDGPGGSRKRKLLDKGYKEGRSPIRLNWNAKMMTDSEQAENKVWQMLRLSEYYDEMPVVQLIQEDVEADDLIAQVCLLESLRDWQKVIVSSDKDFIQLCNDTTILYRPVQKEILNTKRVIEKYGIHPINFALARAMSGDKSDNIQGLSGVGMQSLSKRFSFLSSSIEYSAKDLHEVCRKEIEDKKSKLKIHHTIHENLDVINSNYNMMQLYSPSLSFRVKEIVKKTVENEELSWNKTKFYTMMIKDGFGTWSWDSLCQTFNKITIGEKASDKHRS